MQHFLRASGSGSSTTKCRCFRKRSALVLQPPVQITDNAQESAATSSGSSSGLVTDHLSVYDQVVHLATLADILATAIRKNNEVPWAVPERRELASGVSWTSEAFLSSDGTHLRRVALVSNWSDDRHYSEARSWRSLGEVCVYGLPMQQVVAVIGQSRSGKRHSWWSHGLRHPQNKVLRFRKKNEVGQGFKSSWKEVWREDYDDLTTQDWLQAMLEDEVLKDCLLR